MGGKDVSSVLRDEAVHGHSDAALDMLLQYRVGRLKGNSQSSRSSAAAALAKEVGFDWSKPIIAQIPKLSTAYGHPRGTYSRFIHTPEVLPEPARFFDNEILEFLSRNNWYMIPLIWIPFCMGLFYYSTTVAGLSTGYAASVWTGGLLFWTFLEYSLHRWLFHLDENVEWSPLLVLTHFTIHGVHHLLPMDPLRLVFPPILTAILASGIYSLYSLVMPHPEAVCMIGGGILGYVAYDLTHYALHHWAAHFDYLRKLKTYHLAHHYKNPKLGYGISSKLWDYVFGTVLVT